MKQLFKSDVTGKVYETEQECLDAEKAHNELVLKQNKEKEERKEFADKIKKAYEDYLVCHNENEKKETELYNSYLNLRNDFIDKYGSYHLTVTQKDNLKSIVDFDSEKINKIINDIFNKFWF